MQQSEQEPLDRNGKVQMPAMWLPDFRTHLAVETGVEKNLLLKTWGGIGDQICAEPTLRYALKTFKDCKISLASEHPELFSHLKFHEVFDVKKVKVDETKYFVFETIQPVHHIQWSFMSHMIINCVDYPSLCAFRCMLPISDRTVQLPYNEWPYDAIRRLQHVTPEMVAMPKVVVHAGKHWQSKTFPKKFWDDVLSEIKSQGCAPVLIGANTDDNRGTVNVDTSGCIDLRNQLSLVDTITVLKGSKVLLTNDSSPMHMAMDSECFIGFVATCKHPDYIMHFRKDMDGNPQWAWRQKNFGKGGIWDVLDYCPNAINEVSAENVGDLLETWLPDPIEFARWACDRAKES